MNDLPYGIIMVSNWYRSPTYCGQCVQGVWMVMIVFCINPRWVEMTLQLQIAAYTQFMYHVDRCSRDFRYLMLAAIKISVAFLLATILWPQKRVGRMWSSVADLLASILVSRRLQLLVQMEVADHWIGRNEVTHDWVLSSKMVTRNSLTGT